jgi:glycosyltransferase involved in cell wall biosynthesis
MKVCAVFIPAFRAHNFIADCIRSFDQLHRTPGWRYELRIGVDGCSATASQIDRPFFMSKTNVGAYVMRNSLIESKKADAYCYFDSDDVFKPDFLSLCLSRIDRGEDLVLPAKVNCDATLKPRSSRVEKGGAMVFSHKLWSTLGGFYPARVAADSDFLERAKAKGFNVFTIYQPLYLRRCHSAALTRAPGTSYGSPARREAWAEMCRRREDGVFYVAPVVAELEKMPASVSSLSPSRVRQEQRRARYTKQSKELDFWERRKKESDDKKAINLRVVISQAEESSVIKKNPYNKNNQFQKYELPKYINDAPVYILIRTSRRQEYFENLMESIREQTYKNIVTIVHSDDPRDTYAQGDITIQGTKFSPSLGRGTYNLYCNRLLKAVPEGWGWFHFMDDDDKYHSPEVVERLVIEAEPNFLNIGRVMRGGGRGFPRSWRRGNDFHTECMFLHAAFSGLAEWWPRLGGDIDYGRKLSQKLPVHWIDKLIISQAQNGKNRGALVDIGGVMPGHDYDDNEMVSVLLTAHRYGKAGVIEEMEYRKAKGVISQRQGILSYAETKVIDNREIKTACKKEMVCV